MGGSVRVGVAWILLGCAFSVAAVGQDVSDRQPPAPPDRPLVVEKYQPGATYDSLQAGQDAYRMAEADRQAAYRRQGQLIEDIRQYNAAWAYAYPPPAAGMYVYGSPRAIRRGYARGYAIPVQPPPPPLGLSSPYVDSVRQPTGYEHVLTGRGYIYRPVYAEPAAAENGPLSREPAAAFAPPGPPASRVQRSTPSVTVPPPRPSPPPPPPAPEPAPEPAPAPPAEPAGPMEL
jgi:hypothetical protein